MSIMQAFSSNSMLEKKARFGNKFREIKHYALPFTETYTLRSNDKLRCQMVSNYCRPADAKWHVYCQYDALTYLVSSILTLFQLKMFSLSASNEPILWWILTNWFAQELRFAVLWEKKKWNTLLPLTQWVQTSLWVHSRSSIRNDFTIFKPDM